MVHGRVEEPRTAVGGVGQAAQGGVRCGLARRGAARLGQARQARRGQVWR